MAFLYGPPRPFKDDATSQTTGRGYPSPFVVGNHESGNVDLPRCLLEIRGNSLSNLLREKENWHEKYRMPQISAKWRQEAIEQQVGVPKSKQLSSEMVNYILQELEGYAKLRDPSNGMELGCWERIWKSDSAIPQDLLRRLKEGVARLEAEPKDWHPGSNEQVLDLVHPSLYPVVYGETISNDARTIKLLNSSVDANDIFVSNRFQWMPADFKVNLDGTVELLSPYINNLHPKLHNALYPVISEIVQIAIPFFERVLSDLRAPLSKAKVHLSPGYDNTFSNTLMSVGCIWPDQEQPYNEELEDDDDALEEWIDNQPMNLPRALPEYTGALSVIKRTTTLKGKTLQIIVKLANIHLTPNNPTYKGGSWHVEGMQNEYIVASFIFYHDEENLTRSSLAFRCAVSQPSYHGQDDSKCMDVLYGIDRDDFCIQPRGSLLTKQGRVIAFPNIYQHCVQPFELADPSKPGHRKIVALFLVDPTERIPSSTDIPPQQRSWMSALIQKSAQWQKLPVEVCEKILENCGMSREDAERYRLELMEERRATTVKDTPNSIFQVYFNMCEH